MTSKRSEKMLLERGDDIISTVPTADDVMSLIKTVQSEISIKGPPDLVLEYSTVDKFDEPTKHRLLLMLAFHRTKAAKWIVDFSIPKAPGMSMLLANRHPARDVFEVRTCCGAISEYRVECLVEESAILHRAVEWFLKHHTACPELTWLEYADCVRDVDNSAY